MVVNWNTDEEALRRDDPDGYKRWRLVQLINYGLWGEKLSRLEVLKKWDEIKDQLDIDSRKTIEFFLWGRKWKKEPGLLPDRSNFWDWQRKRSLLASTSI